jgi:hypothetical protein
MNGGVEELMIRCDWMGLCFGGDDGLGEGRKGGRIF